MTLDVDRENENTMVSIADIGFYVSRDAGNTWQLAGEGLPATPVQDLAIARSVFLAAMRTRGLYLSSDSGLT